MVTKHATPKLKFLVQSKTNLKPLSKTIKRFFLFLHVIFALDFGFVKFKSPKMNVLIKLIMLAQSTTFAIVIALSFFGGSSKNVYTYSAFFLDILLYYAFTINLVVVKNSFYNFQTDLNSFDMEINVDSSTYRDEYKIMFGVVLLILYRFGLFTFYYYASLDYSKFPIYSQLIYIISLVGLDTVLLVYASVFYSAYLRLKNFTNFVNYVSTDLEIISNHYLYKNLVDIVEKAKTSFDLMIILALVANTTDATMLIYTPFANKSIKMASTLHVVIAYVIVVQQLLILFAPAFTAGMLTGQVERLKLVLCDKLVTGDSPTKTKDIKRFVGYIEGRPLRFKVWRVVPLDWRLPVVVINIAVTYLIVMIQFTHKN